MSPFLRQIDNLYEGLFPDYLLVYSSKCLSLLLIPQSLDYSNFIVFISCSVRIPTSFRIVLVRISPLCSLRNFTLSLSISTKKTIGILISIALNIEIILQRTGILTILIHLNHEHDLSWHLFKFALHSLNNIL